MYRMEKTVRYRRIINGFTLIELLVVIAIIAILAAILFPVFTSARRNGMRMKCLSNMRQISMAITAYAEQNDNRYPIIINSFDAGTFFDTNKCRKVYYGNYQPLIFSYVKSKSIFMCPSSQRKTEREKFINDYSVNTWMQLYGGPQGTYGIPAKTSQIGNSSRIILLGETINMYLDRLSTVAFRHPSEPDPHGGTNIVFCDGHCQYLRGREEIQDKCQFWKP